MAENTNLPITLPSGMQITIREQNGADDDVLSRTADLNNNFKSFDNFLSGIIVSPKVTADDILKWKANDRYYALLKTRIHSLGNEFKFKCTCPKCSFEKVYEEDLNNFDYAKVEDGAMIPTIGQKGYSSKRVVPYPNGQSNEIETNLSSGRVIKYKIITLADELAALALDTASLSRISELTTRELCYKGKDGSWIKEITFKTFTAREMTEIRASIQINDPSFQLSMIITCANNMCGEKFSLSLITLPDFFFPALI